MAATEILRTMDDMETDIEFLIPRIQDWMFTRKYTIEMFKKRTAVTKSEARSDCARDVKAVGDGLVVLGEVMSLSGSLVSMFTSDSKGDEWASWLKDTGHKTATVGKFTSVGADCSIALFEFLARHEMQSQLEADAEEMESILQSIEMTEAKAARMIRQGSTKDHMKVHPIKMYSTQSQNLWNQGSNERGHILYLLGSELKPVVTRSQELTNVTKFAIPLLQQISQDLGFPKIKCIVPDIVSGVSACLKLIKTLEESNKKGSKSIITEKEIKKIVSQLERELETIQHLFEDLNDAQRAVNKCRMTFEEDDFQTFTDSFLTKQLKGLRMTELGNTRYLPAVTDFEEYLEEEEVDFIQDTRERGQKNGGRLQATIENPYSTRKESSRIDSELAGSTKTGLQDEKGSRASAEDSSGRKCEDTTIKKDDGHTKKKKRPGKKGRRGCFNCGLQNHTTSECKYHQKIKCYFCQVAGHKWQNCWYRPEEWRPPSRKYRRSRGLQSNMNVHIALNNGVW